MQWLCEELVQGVKASGEALGNVLHMIAGTRAVAHRAAMTFQCACAILHVTLHGMKDGTGGTFLFGANGKVCEPPTKVNRGVT